MQIAYKDIILRDYKEEDVVDDIRWMTEEIAWHEGYTLGNGREY